MLFFVSLWINLYNTVPYHSTLDILMKQRIAVNKLDIYFYFLKIIDNQIKREHTVYIQYAQ